MRLAPKIVRLIQVLVSSTVIGLTAGCAHIIGGTGRPAPGLTPRPLVGEVVKQTMLSDAALSHIFDESFKVDHDFPPTFGGPETMYWGWPSARGSDCAGLDHILIGEVYTNARIVNVAHEGWWDAGAYAQEARVINVDEGVVALPTAVTASALFTKFTSQWSHCAGASIDSGMGFHNDISDVHLADSVLEATVHQRGHGTTLRVARALGVRVNCIVEVAVVFFLDQPPEPGKSASDVARRIMDNISERS